MKITKRHLRRIINEEKAKLLTEAAYVHDIFSDAAAALEKRDGEKIEKLAREVEDLMMPDRERFAYKRALFAMAEAAYELHELDYGDL